jgi:PadR family transcriptional regulator PadR
MAWEKGVDFPKDGESSDARIQNADHIWKFGVGRRKFEARSFFGTSKGIFSLHSKVACYRLLLMGDGFDNWTVQLRKGILEFCVLSSIAVEEEAYGYELVQMLVSAPGLDASEGSIYPLLSRMRKQGLIQSRLEESEAGPARKYYRLTNAGKARSLAMQSYYEGLTDAVNSIGNPKK